MPKPYMLGALGLRVGRKAGAVNHWKNGNMWELMDLLEPTIILHTQEVGGSSPCAPTIENTRVMHVR